MIGTQGNPVWDVYDEARTARLSIRYYEQQLTSLRRKNIIIEVVLAVSISSGIASLWIWSTVVGNIIWKSLMTVAAILAIIKPLVNFSSQIQQKSDILSKWRLYDDEIHKLIISIKQFRKYDEERRKLFLTLLETRSSIIQKEPQEAVDENLRRKCFEQVKIELPTDRFFIPEE